MKRDPLVQSKNFQTKSVPKKLSDKHRDSQSKIASPYHVFEVLDVGFVSFSLDEVLKFRVFPTSVVQVV